MIVVSSLLLSIRSKLGDTDITSQRYSDAEIIDSINDALAVLSEELLCFSRTWSISCKDCVTRYALPADFLKPISLKFNSKEILNIVSVESQAQNNCTFTASYDLQTVHLYLPEIKEKDKIELYYNYSETVSTKDESIPLPNNAKEIIVNYVLHLLYQNPIKKDGLQRSSYFYNLYEKKLITFRSRVKMNAQSKNIKTTFTRV